MINNILGLALTLGIFVSASLAEKDSVPIPTAKAHLVKGQAAETVAPSIAILPAARWKEMLEQVETVIQDQSRQLAAQRDQLDRQQTEIEELRQQVGLASAQARQVPAVPDANQEEIAASSVALLNARALALKDQPSLISSSQPALVPAGSLTRPPHEAGPQKGSGTESADAPLSLHFGNGSLTPGGWVDFTSYYRSTDVGSGLGTSFGSIPYSNTVTGGLSELRFTAQSSRMSLRADEAFGATRVFGYGEADFNGYLPSNAYVSTNSDTMRLRVYFTDLSRGRWEVLGGQSWSLLTPNRVGVSPFLSEIYNTLHLDTNYQVGLTYARQAQLRGVYHFNENLALGLSVENPEQFSGGAVSFPALFSTTETDLSSSSGAGGGTATPTLHPDVVAKLSADARWGDRLWHFESAGLLTPVQILTPASVTKTTSAKDIREGAGISSSANLEVVKNLHLVLTGFWSDGGGRYIGGLGPGFAVEQLGSKTGPFQAQLVHSGSGIASAEWQANKANLIAFSYSGAYFSRAFSTDPSTGNLVGYGFMGSPNSNNRALQEGTFATQTTLWKQRGYGAVQVITQSSYVTRAPWYVAPGSPRDAHVFAGYANLRYVLP
jgi:TolA-binding protein